MEDERLLDELRRANPVDESQFDEWVSDKGEAFLRSRVLAGQRATPRGGHRARMLVLIAAGAVIVLVLAVAIPLLVSPRDHTPRGETLEQVVSLAENLGVYHPSVHFDERVDDALVREALGFRILLACEGPDYRLDEPVSNGEFALWLWRAFGSRLSIGEPSAVPGLENLPREEQRAISALLQAGILSLGSDGQFPAGDPLDSRERDRILGLIADDLGP